MKKSLIFLLLTAFLSGCSKLPNDACDFLIHANWEGNDTQCVNVINFKEDNGFSNWCYCGSPVGDGDVSEEFRYDASNHSILLLDCDKEIIEKGTILYVDDWYFALGNILFSSASG